MNTRLLSCLLMLLPLLAHGATPPATAGRPDSADLVIGLLASANPMTSGITRVVTGRMTDGFPVALVPEGYVLLGGAESEMTVMNVAMTMASEVEARNAAEARFTAAGWRRPTLPTPPSSMGGFVSTATMTAPVMSFCGADDVPMTLLVVARAAGGSYVKWTRIKNQPALMIAGASTSSLCRAGSVPGVVSMQSMGMQAYLDMPMPTLAAPTGSRQSTGGSSSSGSGRMSTATVTTTLALGELLRHYVGQVEGKGWTTTSSAVADGAALQSFRYLDDKGRNWRGLLTISAADNGYDLGFKVSAAANGQ